MLTDRKHRIQGSYFRISPGTQFTTKYFLNEQVIGLIGMED